MSKETTVLIVDDEEPIRNLLEAYLDTEYRCITVASADEAIELLKARYFDLVLTDIRMPGISGLELCRFIYAQFPDTKVIAVSGCAEDGIEATRQGAFDYIRKPFTPGRVLYAAELALGHQTEAEAAECRAVELDLPEGEFVM